MNNETYTSVILIEIFYKIIAIEKYRNTYDVYCTMQKKNKRN